MDRFGRAVTTFEVSHTPGGNSWRVAAERYERDRRAEVYAVQQPLAASTLDDVMGTPAWKTLPTWFAVAQHDEVIPPDAERQFAQRMGATTVEVDSSHVVMISHADEVSGLIESAVDAM